MKIFFHGRIHDDSRNPSGTSNNFVVKWTRRTYVSLAFKNFGNTARLRPFEFFLYASPLRFLIAFWKIVRSLTNKSSFPLFFRPILPFALFLLFYRSLLALFLRFSAVLMLPRRIDVAGDEKYKQDRVTRRDSLGHFQRRQRGDSKSRIWCNRPARAWVLERCLV